MKGFTISAKQIWNELKWLLGCFVAVIIFNVYAIIRYQTSWSGFFTTFHVMLVLALLLYVLLVFFRGLFSLVIRFSTRKRKT